MPQRNSGSFFECSRLPFCYFEYLTLGLSVMINQPIPEMNSSWERTIFGRFPSKQLFISCWISNEKNHPLNRKTAKNKLLLLNEKVEFECNCKSGGRQTLEIPSPKVQSYDRRWQQWKMFDVRELNPAKMLNCINELFPTRYGFHVSVWFFFFPPLDEYYMWIYKHEAAIFHFRLLIHFVIQICAALWEVQKFKSYCFSAVSRKLISIVYTLNTLQRSSSSSGSRQKILFHI